MIPDTRVIARSGAHEVLAQRHEIMFADGSAVGLHPVNRAGVPQLMLRALACDSGRQLLFDLTDVHRGLDLDLRQAPERDRVGLVFYGLRSCFKSKREFVLAVRDVALASVAPDLHSAMAAA